MRITDFREKSPFKRRQKGASCNRTPAVALAVLWSHSQGKDPVPAPVHGAGAILQQSLVVRLLRVWPSVFNQAKRLPKQMGASPERTLQDFGLSF